MILSYWREEGKSSSPKSDIPELYADANAPITTDYRLVDPLPTEPQRIAREASRAVETHNTSAPVLTWLDCQRVVRRTWPQFAKSGYALKNLAKHFAIPLRHHDALEDASATALIFQMALAESGRTVQDWIAAVEAPLNGHTGRIERDGDEDGPFAGEVIVFTGSLVMPREEAADKAAQARFDVAGGVTKKTTVLCVGMQDRTKLGGYEKSSKHRKAEELIHEGHSISIIGEADFLRLVA